MQEYIEIETRHLNRVISELKRQNQKLILEKEELKKQLDLHVVVKSLPTKEENASELSKRLIELNNKPEYNNKKAHNEGFSCGWHERDVWIRGV